MFRNLLNHLIKAGEKFTLKLAAKKRARYITPDLSYLDKNIGLISALAETILPQTDSPGAKQAFVHDFIVLMVKKCAEPILQVRFIKGLLAIQLYCAKKYNRPFEYCSNAEQYQVLCHFSKKEKYINKKVRKARDLFFGKSFFQILKLYTVKGYFTSEIFATEVAGKHVFNINNASPSIWAF